MPDEEEQPIDEQPQGGSPADAAKAAAVDKGKDMAKKAFWKLILPYLPIILAVIGVLIIVFFLVIAIVSWVQKGKAGKTPRKPASQQEQLAVLAASNDQQSKVELASNAYESITVITDNMAQRAEGRGNQDVADKISNISSAAASLTTTLSVAKLEQTTTDLENKLKETNDPSYATEIARLKSIVAELKNLLAIANSNRLVIAPRDKEYMRKNEIDGRIIKALMYLITPYPDGAGFNKIKVARIKSSYDTENKQFTKEWPQADQEERLTSAHYDGVAMDISIIGNVSKRLYKRRFKKDVIKGQPPVDINVAWQSSESGKSPPGLTLSGKGNSFGKMAKSQSMLDFFSAVGENLGYDFSKYNFGTGSISSMATSMGLITMEEELGLSINQNEDNSSPETFFKNIGKGIISDCLNLPKASLEGYTDEELAYNIGVEYVAEKLALPAKSLVGETSIDIIKSIGKRKIESIFNMRNYLDYWNPAGDGNFATYLGQDMIEKTLNLPGGAFASDNIVEIKNNIGAEKFDELFANPEQLDATLGLPRDDTYIKSMLSGDPSKNPGEIKRLVGQVIIDEDINNFQPYSYVTGIQPSFLGHRTSVSYDTKNSRDEVWDLPQGSLDKLINKNNTNIFYDIGLDELVKKLTDSDDERFVLREWLTNYKTYSLDDLRYIKRTDGSIVIKPLEEIKNPNLSEINRLNGLIKAQQDELDRQKKGEEPNPEVIKQLQAGIDDLKEQLKIAGEKEGGNEESWVIIEEEYFNEALVLPAHGLSDIFIHDQGKVVFYQVGYGKINDLDDQEATYVDQDYTSASKSKIGYMNMKLSNAETKVSSLKDQRDSIDPLLPQSEKDAQLKQINDDIDLYQRDIDIWTWEIRTANDNLSNYIKKQGENASDAEKKNSCADISMKNLRNGGLAKNIETMAVKNGGNLLASVLDLPQGTLDGTIQRLVEKNNRKKSSKSTEKDISLYAEVSYIDSRDNSIKKIQTNTSTIPISPNNGSVKEGDESRKLGRVAVLNSRNTAINYSPSSVNPIMPGQAYYFALNAYETPEIGFSYKDITDIVLFKKEETTSKQIHSVSKVSSDEEIKAIFERDPIVLVEEAKEGSNSSMNLSNFGAKAVDVASMGANYIEDTLNMSRGSFKGKDLNELSIRVGGINKLFSYFAKGSDANKLVSNLPITSSNKSMFQSAFSPTDGIFTIKSGTTFDLMNKTITPTQYATLVGDAYSRTKGTDYLSRTLDIGDIAGYKLTQGDLLNLMQGNFGEVALKIGSKKIDDGLELPYGTVKAFVKNPSTSCQVTTNKNTGETESCLSNLLAVNGQEKLAHYLNIAGQTTLTNNISENAGQMQVEIGLNSLNPQPVFPDGWFSGQSLDEIVFRISQNLNESTGDTLFFLGKYVDKDSENKLLQKFGFNPSKYSLKSLKTTEFIENSEPYNIAIRVDDALKIDHGTTGRLFNGPDNGGITVDEYKRIAKNAYVREETKSLAYSAFSPEVKDFLVRYNISTDDIATIKNTDTKDYIKLISDNSSKIYFANETEAIENNQQIAGQAILERALSVYMPALSPGWFSGTTLDSIVTNIVHMTDTSPSYMQNLTAYDSIAIGKAENILIQKFGYSPSDYSLNGLKRALSDGGNADKIDKLLHIQLGTTFSFFTEKITPSDYKEKIKKANDTYGPTELVYERIIAGDPDDARRIKEFKNKYGLTDSDLLGAMDNPESFYSKALWNALPAKEMSILFGLGIVDQGTFDRLNIDIKGEYTQNFAQSKVEEFLGLEKGTFSADSSIEKVVYKNGGTKFAKAFGIATDPNAAKNDNNTINFITSQVLQNGGSNYWGKKSNIARASNKDVALGINGIEGTGCDDGLTQCLLTKKVTTAEYTEFVRQNLFKKLNMNDFYDYMASSNAANKDQAGTDEAKFMAYANTYGTLQLLIEDPNNIKNPALQKNILNAFRVIGHIDIDDKAGFTAGTTLKMIENPKDAREILLTQGLRSVAAKNFKHAGALLTFFQYKMTEQYGLDPAYYVNLGISDANDQQNCGVPLDDLQTKEQRVSFVKQNKSLCQDWVMKNSLQAFIREGTEITLKNGTVIPGIDVPMNDLGLLLKGDTRVLAATGFAYLQNSINVKRNQDGDAIELWPPGFQITYQEIRDAMWPTPEAKMLASMNAGLDFDTKWKATHDGKLPLPTKVVFRDSVGGETLTEPNSEYAEYQRQRVEAGKQKQKTVVSEARENLQYKYMDAQANAIAIQHGWPQVPAGFSRVMNKGSYEQKMECMLRYEALYILNDPDLRKNMDNICSNNNDACGFINKYFLDTLANFAGGGKYEDFKNAFDTNNVRIAVMDALFESADRYLAEKWNVQGYSFGNMSISENLINYIDTGIGNEFRDATFKDKGFQNMGRQVILSLVGKEVEERLNLPIGSFQKMYGIYRAYKNYEGAIEKYNVAKQTLSAAQGSTGPFAILNRKLASTSVDVAGKAKNIAKANLKATVITVTVDILLQVFSKELLKADDKLGVPPGTVSSFISMAAAGAVYSVMAASEATSMLAPGIGLAIAAAMFFYTLLWGFSKQEMQITCPGYYTPGSDPNLLPWCKEAEPLYTAWAQVRTRMLIKSLLEAGDKKAGGPDVVPTVIGTFRQEDVDFFNGKNCADGDAVCKQALAKNICNPATEIGGCGFMGVQQSDYMKEFVHINY